MCEVKPSTAVFGCLVVAATAVVLVGCSVQRDGHADAGIPKLGTLEDKLATLKDCGLQLAAPFTKADLLKSTSREDYEKKGFDMTLIALASTEEQEPWRNHSANLWFFDAECVENTGHYKQIAERMTEMTEGALRLDDIRDSVNVEIGMAWLSFTFRGKPVKIKCSVHHDWVDLAIFSKFDELLREADSTKMYMFYGLGGQSCIIGCVRKAEFECLRSKGIKVGSIADITNGRLYIDD